MLEVHLYIVAKSKRIKNRLYLKEDEIFLFMISIRGGGRGEKVIIAM